MKSPRTLGECSGDTTSLPDNASRIHPKIHDDVSGPIFLGKHASLSNRVQKQSRSTKPHPPKISSRTPWNPVTKRVSFPGFVQRHNPPGSRTNRKKGNSFDKTARLVPSCFQDPRIIGQSCLFDKLTLVQR